jgi:hypothetical protein
MKGLASLMRPRALLPLAGVTAVLSLLAFGYAQSNPSEPAAIWVYYTSMCERPGDASACTEIPQPVRRSFDSLEACSAYRNADLGKAANPRLMGSCLRQHEA